MRGRREDAVTMEREALKQKLVDVQDVVAARAKFEQWLAEAMRSQLCEPRHQSTARHCGGQATAERNTLQAAFPTSLAGTEESRRGVQEAHDVLNGEAISHLELLFQMDCVDVE